jgi:hypothetical protein
MRTHVPFGKELAEFDCVAMLDPRLAVIAAANYRKLRGLGVAVRKTVDLVIGTSVSNISTSCYTRTAIST